MSQKTAYSVIRCPDLETLWKKGGAAGGGVVSIHYVKATVSAGPFLDRLGRAVSLPIGMSLSLFCELSFTFLDRTSQQPLEARGSQSVGEDTGVLGERGSRVPFQER